MGQGRAQRVGKKREGNGGGGEQAHIICLYENIIKKPHYFVKLTHTNKNIGKI